MPLSRQEARQVWLGDRHRERKRLLIAWLATAAVFLLCMCFRYNAYYFSDKFVPLQYAKSLFLAVRLLVSRIFGTDLYRQKDAAIAAVDSIIYYGALARLKITVMSFVAGGALALSGAIFQTAYQNPMASPNIIGATAGVRLGNALVVMMFSAAVYQNILLRYEYCYGLTVICMGIVLILGKLAGGKSENYSIMEMIMAGSIVSQVFQVFSMYLMYTMEDEDLLIYEEIQLGTYIDTDVLSVSIFFAVMAVAVIPVVLMRYRMNALGLGKLENTAMGLRAGGLRMVGQICGGLMVTCAMIHFGDAGMMTMVIPYIVRQSVGSDFRHLCTYSILAGGVLMMLCRLATSFVLVASAPIPVTFIMNLVLTPIFLVIIARQGRQSNAA